MLDCIVGFHHVTSVASDPRLNKQFFCDVLGLSLVKKTVNFDNPSVYHLYFGDPFGAPGTLLTYFPFPNRARGRRGLGEACCVTFCVPLGSLAFWYKYLARHDVHKIREIEVWGEKQLRFDGPDGEQLALCESDAGACGVADRKFGSEVAILGLHSVEISVSEESKFDQFLSCLGYKNLGQSAGRERFGNSIYPNAGYVDLNRSRDLSVSVQSAGSVHHVAFSVASDADQKRAREVLLAEGYKVTEIKDRSYFKAIYTRTEDGILIEIATQPPGFAVDELSGELGQHLMLPAKHEHLRATLESSLMALD